MNNLIAKYLLFLPGQSLRGEYVLKYVHEFEKTQWLRKEELEKIQWEKLLNLIQFAAKKSPFYSKLYGKSQVSPNDIRTKTDLLNLPQLSKDDLRYKQDEMVASEAYQRYSWKTTGGSTGQAVTVRKSRKAMAYQDAAMWRSLRWFGIDIGDRQARFWGVPIGNSAKIKNKFIDFLMNRVRLSGDDFNDQSMSAFYKKIHIFKPKYFYGYVSMLNEFAQFCEKEKIADFGLKGVVTTSEPLSAETRDYLKSVFNCPIINDFGSGEVGPIAYDCPFGGFHLMADNLYVEIVNEKGTHASEGEKGEVVVTELNSYSLPLIRYNLQDIAQYSKEECKCGRGLPLIKEVVGRDRDLLIASNGKKVHGAFFNQVAQECKKKGLGLKQYQVIQTKVDNVLVKIVVDSGYSAETSDFVKKQIKEKIGENVNVDIELVDEIEREKSGKLRVIKCEIEK